MKSFTKTSRVNTTLQIIQPMNDDMAVVIACKIVGLLRNS